MADKQAPKRGHFLPGDHGSAKSLILWMNQGFARTDPGACNTFVAASAKVS